MRGLLNERQSIAKEVRETLWHLGLAARRRRSAKSLPAEDSTPDLRELLSGPAVGTNGAKGAGAARRTAPAPTTGSPDAEKAALVAVRKVQADLIAADGERFGE